MKNEMLIWSSIVFSTVASQICPRCPQAEFEDNLISLVYVLQQLIFTDILPSKQLGLIVISSFILHEFVQPFFQLTMFVVSSHHKEVHSVVKNKASSCLLTAIFSFIGKFGGFNIREQKLFILFS